MKKTTLVLSLLLIQSGVTKSYASTTVGAVGAYNNSNVSLTQSNADTTTSSNNEFGGGLLITSQFYRRLGAEIGFFYLQNKSDFSLSGNFTGSGNSTWDTIQIPIMIRFWLFPALSLGAGGYIEHLVGSVKSVTTLTSPFAITDTQSNTPTPTEGFGAVVSVQFQIPLWRKLKWVVDGRYEIGLTEFSGLGNGSSAKSNHLLILSGLGLHF